MMCVFLPDWTGRARVAVTLKPSFLNMSGIFRITGSRTTRRCSSCLAFKKETSLVTSGRLSCKVGSGTWRYFFSTGGMKSPLSFKSSRFISQIRAALRGVVCRLRTPASTSDSIGMRTTRSLLTAARQAWRYPLFRSSVLSFSDVPPSTSPFSIITLHFPQTPSPPQDALI